MCEVGEVTIPLSDEQMEQVAEWVASAWNDAVTEHVRLCIMFTTGSPYMTIYNDDVVQCTDHRILEHLYKAGEQTRTAQAFLLVATGGESVDVINIHAPSGTRTLKDSQRRVLLTNLLQSESRARPGVIIGNAHFLIGGDMNTPPMLMSQLLKMCENKGLLHPGARVHEKNFAKDGDLCISGGIQASILDTIAGNHDPEHDPYGICWVTPQYTAPSDGYAPEQPSSSQRVSTTTPTPETTMRASVWNEARAAPAGGSDTEQPVPVFPTPGLKLETIETSEQELSESESLHPLEMMHKKSELIITSEELLQESQEGAAATAATAATEHSDQTTSLPTGKKMIYAIVNAFLDNMTFHYQEAEELLLATLNDETCLTDPMYQHVQEVFTQIFFYYPNGLKDRSVWQARDANQYIHQWYKLAAMRAQVIPQVADTEDDIVLSKPDVTKFF